MGDLFFLTDLGSTNGTFVAGHDGALPPYMRHPLQPGGRFLLGKVAMRLVMAGGEEAR